MNTTERGNATEGAVLAALMRSGRIVLVPFGLQTDYDLVFERDGKFWKVQCKTGRVRHGAILFNLYTVKQDKETGKYKCRPYRERVDFYGVYCEEVGRTFLVPSSDVGVNMGSLRLIPTKSGRKKGIRLAEDYELK